jgi:hypothetical protein
MINKNEAPFGFYAVDYDERLFGGCRNNCDLFNKNVPCPTNMIKCISSFRKDKTEVFYKARWWFKPILFILKLRSK